MILVGCIDDGTQHVHINVVRLEMLVPGHNLSERTLALFVDPVAIMELAGAIYR